MGYINGLRSRLASTADETDSGDATPQARDEDPFIVASSEYTEEPDTADINEWVEEYKENPLLKVPAQIFVSDVVEPGYETTAEPADPSVDTETWDEPTVPDQYPNSSYHGLELSAALDRWLSRCVITGDSYDRDFRKLLQQALKDAIGRRGTAMVEHVYGNPAARDRILGLRAFKTEEITGYTRAGKAILLRPDDTLDSLYADQAGDIDADGSNGVQPTRPPTLGVRGERSRSSLPETRAGKTAAYVQFDDSFGVDERDEIKFALDDVTLLSNDPDTGELFGRPDTASVVPRAKALRKQLDDVDQGLRNAAWNNLIANVKTDDKEEAKEMLSGLDPNTPDSVSVTNTDPGITQIQGEAPDVTPLLQQEIEYIVAAMPTPLYRIGFEGEINRDVTTEQSDDYEDRVSTARRELEAAFRRVLEMKACEFLTGSAHPEEDAEVDLDEEGSTRIYGNPQDVPDVSLSITPDEETNPLETENFDAAAFKSFIDGLKAAAPGGQVTQLITAEALIDLIPGLDPEEVMPEGALDGEDAGGLEPLDEMDPQVREMFDQVTQMQNGSPPQPPEQNGAAPDAGEQEQEPEAAE